MLLKHQQEIETAKRYPLELYHERLVTSPRWQNRSSLTLLTLTWRITKTIDEQDSTEGITENGGEAELTPYNTETKTDPI